MDRTVYISAMLFPEFKHVINYIDDYISYGPEYIQTIKHSIDVLCSIYILLEDKKITYKPGMQLYGYLAYILEQDISEAFLSLSEKFHNGHPPSKFLNDEKTIMAAVKTFVYNINFVIKQKSSGSCL